jgi:MFS-type transporter involved in bile tolerance (Atg22 family)
MAKKSKIRTGVAFVIWAVLLTTGYYYTGFKPDAQFWIYALFLTLGLGGYTGKRLLQRLPRFNGRK